MRLDGASMLTMLYEGEPGWSGPSRSAPTNQGRAIEAKCLSCRTIWKRGPRTMSNSRVARDNSGKRMPS
jgi:hypothetical protein